ncbi:MAG: exodeoxyribonuclease V subunit gamma, partial [Pseudomonadota bacterium]
MGFKLRQQIHVIASKFAHLPKRLFVFGISSLPPRYMDALKA